MNGASTATSTVSALQIVPDARDATGLRLLAGTPSQPSSASNVLVNGSGAPAGAVGIDVRLSTRVDPVLATTRVGADGVIINEILADYTQWIRPTPPRVNPGLKRAEGL